MTGIIAGKDETFALEQPKMLCVVGQDGSVRWTEHANAQSIMDYGKLAGGGSALTLLALWYATGGEDRDAQGSTPCP